MPDSSPGWLLLGVFYLVMGIASLGFIVFCIAAATWGAWQVMKLAWRDTRYGPQPPSRGFDVLAPAAVAKAEMEHEKNVGP